MPRLFATLAALCLTAGALLLAATPASSQNIYDSQVEQKLTGLTSAQRAKVNAIISEGEQNFTAILRKYGIDPNARPEFERLKKASDELIGYRRKQRAAMAKILNEEQLDEYDDIIEATGARVRKAAQ